MIKNKEQRVGVFVDVSNMYYAARHFKSRLNFKALLTSAVAGRKLIRAVAYAVQSDNPEEKKFFQALERAGFEVKLKKLLTYYGGKKKGDWDVGLAIDAVRMSEMLDVLVIVAGDGDYVPLVEYLQNQGRLVEIAAFNEGASSALVERADDFIDLSQNKGKYLTRIRRSRGQ